jgi:hypothetical protein
MKLTTHLHLVPRPIMVELYLHSSQTSSRGGTLTRNKDNFTFQFLMHVVHKGTHFEC